MEHGEKIEESRNEFTAFDKLLENYSTRPKVLIE